MTVEKLFDAINIRAQYKARVGFGELPFTDGELKVQLEKHLNTAINEVVKFAKTDGAVFNVKVENGAIAVELSGDNVVNIDALKVAVREYLEHEVAYLWWMEFDPSRADGSAKLLLADKIKKIVYAASPASVVPEKRTYKMVFIPEGRYTIE